MQIMPGLSLKWRRKLTEHNGAELSAKRKRKLKCCLNAVEPELIYDGGGTERKGCLRTRILSVPAGI